MQLKELEGFSDRSLSRLDKGAEEHFDGKREDKSAMVQAGLANATARQIGANLNIRKQNMREKIAAAI
jgi:hypothetical protein